MGCLGAALLELPAISPFLFRATRYACLPPPRGCRVGTAFPCQGAQRAQIDGALRAPCAQPAARREANLNAPAIKKWLAVGAQPTETVANLLKKVGGRGAGARAGGAS